MAMSIGILTLHLFLPDCKSLKDKRSRLKPLLARLHREFNISAAEIDLLDHWRESIVVCTIVSNDKIHNEQVLQKIIVFTENHFEDLQILKQGIELI
jgi:uncharacterized protein